MVVRWSGFLVINVLHCSTAFSHWIRVTPLSLTKKFRNHMVAKKLKVLREFHWQSFWSTRLTKMSQWLHLNNSHAYPFCKTTPGTISESHQQSCAIELRQQFFRCSNCDHIFFSETCSKQSQNYSVSESEGAPIFLVKSYWATFIDIWLLFSGHTDLRC